MTVAKETGAPSRPYRSTLRAEQAARTRAAVLDAAGRLFVRDGYAATTMRAIATDAGVSVESVYAQGSKASLLLACVDRTVAGDDEAVPMAERADFLGIAAAAEAGDPAEALRRFGDFAAARLDTAGPVHAAFGRASAADPELAAAWAEYQRRRRADMGRLAAALAGSLRPGLTAERAADVIWAVVSPAVIDMLRRERGWSAAEVVDWIVDSLRRLLLP